MLHIEVLLSAALPLHQAEVYNKWLVYFFIKHISENPSVSLRENALEYISANQNGDI